MIELTISVSNELAERLKPIQNKLPELLWQISENASYSNATKVQNQNINKNYVLLYQEIIDFLIQRPTPEEITKFKVSDKAQNRL